MGMLAWPEIQEIRADRVGASTRRTGTMSARDRSAAVRRPSRRSILVMGAAGAAGMLAAACGGASNGGASSGGTSGTSGGAPVTVQFGTRGTPDILPLFEGAAKAF